MPGNFRKDFERHWAVIIPVIWKLGSKTLGVNERHQLPCHASFSSLTLPYGPTGMQGRKPLLSVHRALATWGLEEEALL